MTPRCEHGCVIVNPASAPKSHICELCHVDLVSKTSAAYREWRKTQPAEKFVQGVTSIGKVEPTGRRAKRRWDDVRTFNPGVPERYRVGGATVIDLFAWGYTPHVPAGYSVRSGVKSVTVTPTGLSSRIADLMDVGMTYTDAALTAPSSGQVISLPEPKWNENNVTVGRAIADAFDARRTLTSLDKDFRVNGSIDAGDDGDDVTTFEPTESMTMNVPSSEPEKVETVKLGHGPARSFVEADVHERHAVSDLHVLPSVFTDKALGIKSRADAFVLHETLRAMREFDQTESDGDGVRDKRVAEFIKAKWVTPFTNPKTDGTEAFAMTKAEDNVVTRRLRSITAKQVRRTRERLQALGIYASPRGNQ
jgi:hypothetical protein